MSGESMTYFADWRGHDVLVGDTVLYPRMSGRSCEMQEGKVLEIKKDGTRTVWTRNPDHNPQLPSGRPGEENAYYLVEELPQYKIKIMPTRSSRGFGRWSDKPVWIQLGENVTAVR